MTVRPQSITVITYDDNTCKVESSYFSLYWIHSVDKTPWIEHYERIDSGFTLTHSIFRTFGAGVPHYGNLIKSNDGMIHYEMNQFIAEINWIVDKDVSSTIILSNDQPWKIYQEMSRYSEIQIHNKYLNFWQRLLIRNCHESY